MKKSMIAAAAALLLLLLFAIVVFAEEPDHEHVAGETRFTVIATPTCAEDGAYQVTTLCAICGAEMETVAGTLEKNQNAHVPMPAVIEEIEPATCMKEGKHYSVIFCKNCGMELARTLVIDPVLYYHVSEYSLARTVIQKEDGYYVTFEDETCPDIKKDASVMAPLVGKTFAPGKYFLGDGSVRTCADGDMHCAFCGMVLESAIPHVLDKGNWVPSEKYPWASQKVYKCLICGAERRESAGGSFGGKYYPYGDVDGDYKVTEADARLALRASVQLEEYDPASRDFYCADYDGDGTLSAEDARSILQTAVNLKSLRWVGYIPYPYWRNSGDVDGDGAVTPSDARIVLRYSVGLGQLDKVIVGDDQVKAADIDENGKVESADARLILRLAVGLPID